MPEHVYFSYVEQEVEYLKSRDTVLGIAIDEIGHVYREAIPDMFTALVRVSWTVRR